jgi:hypothetical protein
MDILCKLHANTSCNPRTKRQFQSSKAIRQSSIADNGFSTVGQPIEESGGLESGKIEGSDKVSRRHQANLIG